MKPYNQMEVDARLEALLQRCRELGFHRLAEHYAKSQGAQRVHAIRALEAMFEIRAQNIQKKTRVTVITIAGILILFLFYWIQRGSL